MNLLIGLFIYLFI